MSDLTLFDLTWFQLTWIAAVFFFAFVVRGMSGFGAGMIAVPLLASGVSLLAK